MKCAVPDNPGAQSAERHVMLPDLLLPGLRLVVCGSAAGDRSAKVGAYYAGPGNKFWMTLHHIGLTPRQLDPSEYGSLLEYGIGLTDVVKGQSGMDSVIDFRHPERGDLRARILANTPRWLCFNGKRAAQEHLRTRMVKYGLQAEPVGVTKLFVAPSTSGAANGAWDLSVWEQLADLVRAPTGG